MRRNPGFLLALALTMTISSAGRAAEPGQFPQDPTFSTLITTPLAIEGLTGDSTGNLYTTGRASEGTACPVWRINLNNPSLDQIGSIPTGCGASGITLDNAGNIYIADSSSGGRIWQLTSANMNPTIPFATGVSGTNGLAFDKQGNLWTGDGTTGQGRVWKITGSGANCAPPSPVNCAEVLRVQPMAATGVELGLRFGSGATFGSSVTAVGRDVRTLPPGTINASRAATDTAGSQPLVANGVAFTRNGDLLILDTARGAIWRAQFNSDGTLKSETDCDPVFAPGTLCLANILVAHPLIEGADGFVLDEAGNLWIDANERNAVVAVTANNRVVEIFRNQPDATTHLRNAGPLETPTSPFISGQTFCTSNSDGNRRDNSPNTAGEIGGPGQDRGKISCMNEPLQIPGLPLPINNEGI
ncbi:MAG: SMP-30/gluconolactonase/LRE family protein [Candidatus Binatia bacterium]